MSKRHVCGLMGFNPMKDNCQACEDTRNGNESNSGKKREHVCGLMGFNPMKGDSCSVCEEKHIS